MNTEDLQSEATRLMNNFKGNMIKKNEKTREKAVEKWQKRNPGKKIEDFSSSQFMDSSFMSSNADMSSFYNDSVIISGSIT